MSEPRSGADVLAAIKPKLREESTELILRPDLFDAWETANQELAESKANDEKSGRLATGISKRTRELAKRVAELEEEIKANAVEFRFRAMPKDRWRALCDSHPPRKGNDLDQFAGYNRDAVIDASVRECLIDPDFDDEAWEQFERVVNPAEWQELRNVASAVNRSVSDAPKSPLASRILNRPGSD